MTASAAPVTSVSSRRASLLIFFAITCVNIGQTVVFAILAPLGRQVGLVEWQIGTIIACSSLVFSVASPRWGRFSDRVGRKPVMLFGLVGYTAGTVLFASVFWAAMHDLLAGLWLFVALVVARMLQSMVMSATSPSATAYLSDITAPHERTAAMGLISAGHSLGAIAGPAVAWFAFISLLAPMYIVSVATLIAAVMVMKFLPASEAQVRQPATAERARVDRQVLPFIAVGVTMYAGFAIVQQTLGYYIQDKFGLDAVDTAQRVGYVMLATAVTSLVSQALPVRRWGWRPVSLMKAGLLLMMAGFAGVALSVTVPMLAVAMGLVGMGMGMAGPGFSSAATLSAPAAQQGAVAGLVAACPAMGFISGPLIGALFYHVDAHLPSWGAALMFVPLSVFVFRSRRIAVH